METNLPAVPEQGPPDPGERLPVAADRPWTVALLPLALVTFFIIALVITVWTFFSAAF